MPRIMTVGLGEAPRLARQVNSGYRGVESEWAAVSPTLPPGDIPQTNGSVIYHVSQICRCLVEESGKLQDHDSAGRRRGCAR